MVELDHGLAHFGDRTNQFVGRQSMAEPYLAKNCGKTTGMGDLLSTTTPHAVPRSPTQVTESKTSKAVCTALTRVVFGVRCGIRRPGVWMVQKSWETDKDDPPAVKACEMQQCKIQGNHIRQIMHCISIPASII